MNSRRLKSFARSPDHSRLLTLRWRGFFSVSHRHCLDGHRGSPWPAMQFVLSFSNEVRTLKMTIGGFANSFTTNRSPSPAVSGTEIDVQTLCIGQTCIDEAQLQALLAGQEHIRRLKRKRRGASDAAAPTDTSSSDDAQRPRSPPPVIQINGDNPAIIQVGDTYNDLGATITGPQADLNLGIKTFLNGTAMSPVQIDTSQAATDTIDYVATDQSGLTSTSTRTVIVEPTAPPPPNIFTDNASSTDGTTATGTSDAPPSTELGHGVHDGCDHNHSVASFLFFCVSQDARTRANIAGFLGCYTSCNEEVPSSQC